MQTEDKHREIDNLILSYLSGKIDNKSLRELDEWCKESPESNGNLVFVRSCRFRKYLQ